MAIKHRLKGLALISNENEWLTFQRFLDAFDETDEGLVILRHRDYYLLDDNQTGFPNGQLGFFASNEPAEIQRSGEGIVIFTAGMWHGYPPCKDMNVQLGWEDY